ncbi:MAG: hypothetical protein LBU95_03425 [Rikenellaceae bacterium]|jgi:hypothetical protein|nr:hypothetical protein [Rikenellaceae bacterium]
MRTPGMKDWMSLVVGQLTVHDTDLRKLLDGQGLHADSVGASGIVIESYKNRQAPIPPRVKPLLHRLLQDIPLPFAVRVMHVAQSTAIYEELPANGNQAGRG